MKRGMQAIVPALLGICALSGAALAGGGDASLLLGQRALAEGEFEDARADSAPQFGVAVSLDFDWPVALALDLLASSDDKTVDLSGAFPYEVATDVDTLELGVGIRKFFREETRLRPYIGGGLSWIQLDAKQVESGSFGPGTEFETTVIDDDDAGAGVWLDGGLHYRFGSFHIGADVRWSDASADLTPEGFTDSVDLDSGGFQYSAVFGFHW